MSDSNSPPAADAPPVVAPVPVSPADTPCPNGTASALPLVAAEDDGDDEPYAPPEPYDPADYRWVPVRRRPRHDGWTEEKQRRFIEVLADTGMVGAAAKAVGLSRETAYRLRRAEHGAAFARAWDAARHHAGAFLEDVAFERAIEGVARHVYDGNGEIVATRHVYNDRLLAFLLTHLKPERYGKASAAPSPAPLPADTPPVTVEACLRAMEPQLPAPAESLLDPDTLADELVLADVVDGKLPHFLNEQRPEKSPEQLKAEKIDAQHARGAAVHRRMEQGNNATTKAEFADMCHYLDPTYRTELARQRFR